jgi:hypothetical protein
MNHNLPNPILSICSRLLFLISLLIWVSALASSAQAEEAPPTNQLFLPLIQQTTDSAELMTFDVTHAASVATAISIGDTINGAISVIGETDSYTFNATANQKIYLDALQSSNVINISWQLLNASGTRIASNSAFFDSDVITLASGAYTLIVDGDGDGTGTYRFKLWDVPPPHQFAINIGDTVTVNVPGTGAGNIEQPGVYDSYTFNATANQQIYLDALQSTNTVNISWRLLDAFGTRIASDSAFFDSNVITLASGGVYTLIVDGDGDGTGTYRFKLWDVPPPHQFAIAIGDTVATNIPGIGAGNIEQPGVYDSYTFNATANQQIFLDALQSTNTVNISWRLLDAFGTRIASDSAFFDSNVITLAGGGAYTLIVDGDGDGTGTYAFKLSDPNATTSTITIVNDAVPNSGTNFRFTGGLGSFYLDDITPQDSDNYSNSKSFTVAPGVYDVTEVVPSTWLLAGITCNPTANGNVNLGLKRVSITVAAGVNVTCTFTNQLRASFNTLVFDDQDQDRRYDAGEPGLPNWTVSVYDSNNVQLFTKTTDAAGNANFTRQLAPNATYKICVDVAAGWTRTVPATLDPVLRKPCYIRTPTPGRTFTLRFGNKPLAVGAAAEEEVTEVVEDVTLEEAPEVAPDESGYDADYVEEEETMPPTDQPAPAQTQSIFLPFISNTP